MHDKYNCFQIIGVRSEYLKQSNCEQTNDDYEMKIVTFYHISGYKLSLLDRNALYRIIDSICLMVYQPSWVI